MAAAEVKTAPGGSAGNSGLESYGHARAADFAGIKTVTAVLPYGGFGNTLHADGSITTDTNQLWTYTKRVETISWTTNFYFFRAPSIPTQVGNGLAGYAIDTSLPSPGGCSTNTIWDGYNYCQYIGAIYITNGCPDGHGGFTAPSWFCVYDTSSETNYVPEASPATGSGSCSSINTQIYWQAFATNGTSVTVPITNVGILTNAPISDPSFITSSNVAGGTYTFITSGYLTNGWGLFGYSGGIQNWPCVGGSPYNVNYLVIGLSATQTVTYSDPVYLTNVYNSTVAWLDSVDLRLKYNRLWYFDSSNCPVLVTWNPVWFPQASSLSVTLSRATNGGGFGSIHTEFYSPPTSSSGSTNEPQYLDPQPIIGGTYSYKIDLFYNGSTPLHFLATNSITCYSATAPFMSPLTNYIYSQQTTNAASLNLSAVQAWYSLGWQTMANATNSNVGVAIYPLTNMVDFILTTNLNYKARPLFLTAYGEPVGSNQVSFAVSGTAGYFSAKSLGYLPGNVPPSTNYEQRFFFTNSVVAGGSSSEITGVWSTNFPRGSLPTNIWGWQVGKLQEFNPSNCPSPGYIIYR